MTPTATTNRTAGLHHVTAMAGDPQRNIDFYAGTLGLRLVKVTVNFDDPGTHHLYYGDAAGRPGTILTFFPWLGVHPGRRGSGETVETAFLIPRGSQTFWRERLRTAGVALQSDASRFSQDVLRFRDPDGMGLSLIEAEDGAARDGEAWPGAASQPIDVDAAILGFHSVTLSVAGYEDTAKVLVDALGMTQVGQEGSRFRFRSTGTSANVVDVLCRPELPRGRLGVGSVHHVAFRADGPPQQNAFRTSLHGRGLNVTPVVDRNYFESIYFREPGGVLFEIATNPPGFAADEPAASMGTRLMLPPQYERLRAELKTVLPKLRLPGGEELS